MSQWKKLAFVLFFQIIDKNKRTAIVGFNNMSSNQDA
jgi:hypothetical protein